VAEVIGANGLQLFFRETAKWGKLIREVGIRAD
jgi:hypothetical protein